MQCFRKVFRPLDLFYILRYSLILKMIYLVFLNVHTMAHKDKATFLFIIVLNDIYFQTLYFVETAITASSLLGYNTTSLAHLHLGSFSHSSLQILSNSVRLHSYFQVSPEMFDRVQVRTLAGPLKDIQRLVSKTLLHYLSCVLIVVVLLKGEHLPQSEVLSALEQVFIMDISVLCYVHLSLDPASLPVTDAEKITT